MKCKQLGAVLLIISLLVSITSCATSPRIRSDDPFSEQLDNLYQKRLFAQRGLTISVISIGVGLIGGTAFATLHSLGAVSNNVYPWGLYSSYGLSVLGVGAGITSFVIWNNSMNDYLETLRLQSQYYNTQQH